VNKDIARSDNYGLSTPNGPNYTITDRFTYRKSPGWKMSRSPREKLNTEAQYEYYHR
jgi:hypothetical protein